MQFGNIFRIFGRRSPQPAIANLQPEKPLSFAEVLAKHKAAAQQAKTPESFAQVMERLKKRGQKSPRP